ncbi:hypothetical protein MAR_006594 [Mya arenaria]|uniref:DBF4-type domain-containing protein n=1 Tax=Mya arenaria TaxID=6604 RepID=A0ABY7DDI3_MYAAR|nr:hypothetical protein MAR_006594 [Mya arenaria]
MEKVLEDTRRPNPRFVASDSESSGERDIRIIRGMEEIKTEQKEIKAMLATVLQHLDVDHRDCQVPEGITLPLYTLEDVERNEGMLQDSTVFKMMVDHLSSIGGSSVKAMSKRVMKVVRKNSAVKRNFPSSDNSVTDFIKDWLRNARDRDGGRQKRMKHSDTSILMPNLLPKPGRPSDPFQYGDGSPTYSPFDCEHSPSPGCTDEKKLSASSLLENAQKWGVKIVSLEGAVKWINRELKKLPTLQPNTKKSSKCISSCEYYTGLKPNGEESQEERGELLAAQEIGYGGGRESADVNSRGDEKTPGAKTSTRQEKRLLLKYDNLDRHVQEECHRLYVKDKTNYAALDSMITSGPSSCTFLHNILTHAAIKRKASTRKLQPIPNSRPPRETDRDHLVVESAAPEVKAWSSPRKLNQQKPAMDENLTKEAFSPKLPKQSSQDVPEWLTDISDSESSRSVTRKTEKEVFLRVAETYQTVGAEHK